ncbi:MAG: hypothetical protein Q9214_002884 [Letrouitia sp. 1 TL-2023]
MVPTFIEEIFVSNSISKKPGHEFDVYAKSEAKDHRRNITSMHVVNSNSGEYEPIISINNLTCTTLAKNEVQGDEQEQKKLCFEVLWQPDVDLLSADDIANLGSHIQPPQDEENKIRAQERAGFYCMDRALKSISLEEVANMKGYHKKLYACMQYFCKAVRQEELGYPTRHWLEASEDEVTELIKQVSASGGEGGLLCHVGAHLLPIMRGEVEALSVMVEEDRLENYYIDNSRFARTYEQATTYINILAHKNPHLNILEIGAGTAGFTVPILNALGGADGDMPRFKHFDFTDISSGFFENSKQKLTAWNNLISYRKLDIESNPLDQGYEEGSYDVVLAANVLHATKSMQNTMTNVRKLLKPGGRLILVELTHERMTTSTIFGTLPGWWAGVEEGRQKGPTLTELEWDQQLRQTGFAGLRATIRDSPGENRHQGAMMVAEAAFEETARYPEVLIVTGESSVSALVTHLEQLLQGLGIFCKSSTLAQADPRKKVCIVLSELSDSLLRQPSYDQFESIRKLFLESAGVLWVVNGSTIDSTRPVSNMVTGLSRTVRSESGGATMVATLDMDAEAQLSSNDAAQKIFDVFQTNFNQERQSGDLLDVEFAERRGRIQIPRIIEDRKLNNFIGSKEKPIVPEDQLFSQEGRSLTVEIGVPGLLDSLHFIDDPRMVGELPPDCVEIEVKASGINFRDVMMAMGQINVETLGGECSGVVTAIGKEVEGLSIGDRVITYAMGTFCNHVRQKSTAVQVLPSSMEFEVGATLPIIYCTAYHSVFHVARLRRGESVLIHAASGGLGQATIMLCQMAGAEIFATVGNIEKKDLLIKEYGIPEDHIFSSRDGSFAKGVMRMTGEKGVDVIMNSVAGDALRITWNCIAPFGRFIELGKRDFAINTRLEMNRFARNVTFAAVDFIGLVLERFDETAKMWSTVMTLVRSGIVRPPQPITIFGMSELEKALRTMQSGRHVGKLVAVPQPNESVKAVPRILNASKLRADASYLLVGGLGGLGRATALWMMRQGAKNFVFASRSGMAKQEAKDTVDILNKQGANVAVIDCDVSKQEQVEALVAKSKSTMPPIRGVIQGAMVLRDALFQNLSLSDYNATVQPKVQGTWNLHNSLSKTDLDFFILLSSASGILGNTSQAAYAAASTFMDAFADYRNRIGLPAISFDLGVIDEIGYVAENKELKQALDKQGFEGIHESELMAMIESAIVTPRRKRASGQTITGLGMYNADGSQPTFEYPMFSHFRRIYLKTEQVGGLVGNQVGNARESLRKAASVEEGANKVCEAIIAKMSSLLMLPADDISSAKPMSEYGIDSLVAVEMRNWLFREMDANIPILELLAKTSLLQLSEKIVRRSRLVDPVILGKSAGE